MANILFIPIHDTGHLNPTYRMARSLLERGHDVRYATTKEWGDEAVKAAGFRVIQFERVPIPFPGPRSGPLGRFLRHQHFRRAQDALVASFGTQMKNLEREFSPDLICLDALLFGGHLALANAGYRTMVYHTSLPETDGDWSNPPFIPGSQNWRIRRRLDRISQRWTFVLWALASPFAGTVARKFRQAAIDPLADFGDVVLCPREFEFPAAVAPSWRVYGGPSVEIDRPWQCDGSFDEMKGSGPLIFCSLGTMASVFPTEAQRVLSAVSHVFSMHPEWRGIVCGESLEGFPSNVRVERRVPQIEVLRRADLMITHAGLGSVKECILHGVPMIGLPLGWDQPGNAARIDFHGLGLSCPAGRVTTKSLDEMIRRVLSDPSFRSRTQRMGDVFRREDEADHVVALVDKILAGAVGNGATAMRVWRETVVPAIANSVG
jgi:MGT family glycosyltransferase